MSPFKTDLKEFILDYLDNNRRMTLATCSENTPWAATIFFAFDDKLNFYFISDPNTRKIKNLEKNPQVSGAINEFVKKVGSTIGVQLEGTAEMLDKKKNVKELEVFTKRFDWADDYLHDHELFRITPKKIYYLNDELFGPQGREILVVK